MQEEDKIEHKPCDFQNDMPRQEGLFGVRLGKYDQTYSVYEA